ncbi:hypothetical protein ES703_40121 [subsurface metagenome]
MAKMRNEISYILIGKRSDSFRFDRLVRKKKGTPGSVEFDWEWVLRREEKKGDVRGFYHTHLNNREISERDIKTMMAWTSCFGKSLFCIVEDSSSRKNKTYVFPPHSDLLVFYPHPEVLRIFRLILGVR